MCVELLINEKMLEREPVGGSVDMDDKFKTHKLHDYKQTRQFCYNMDERAGISFHYTEYTIYKHRRGKRLLQWQDGKGGRQMGQKELFISARFTWRSKELPA